MGSTNIGSEFELGGQNADKCEEEHKRCEDPDPADAPTDLEQQAEILELRQCWLVALALWDEQLSMIQRAAKLALQQPITETEYAQKQKELDGEWVPVAELAELLAGERSDWAETDFEHVEGWPEPVITDAAWERACAEEERRLRQAVRTGELSGRGKGSALLLQEGDFNVWAGRSSRPVPNDLLQYRVVPDAEVAEVLLEQAGIDRLRQAIDWQPLVAKDEPLQKRPLDYLAGHLRKSLQTRYSDLWQAIRGVDLVLEEVSSEFEGVDPLMPRKRDALDGLRARMHRPGEELIFLDVEIELPEPD
jgi:hypothetical protein